MRIGLDTFGGDFAPQSTILGAIAAQKELAGNASIFLIGDEKLNRKQIEEQEVNPDFFQYIHTK